MRVSLSLLLAPLATSAALTGKCVGEIESFDAECNPLDNQTDCEAYGVSIMSDGKCDWIDAATICSKVRGNVEKRCERCITKKAYTDYGCEFDAEDHKCKGPGDPTMTTKVETVDDCPLRKFPSTQEPPNVAPIGDCGAAKNNRGCRMKAATCNWNRVTEKCVPLEDKPCYQFLYNNLCTGPQAPHCRFNSKTKLCVPKAELPCSEFTVPQRCTKNGCTYENGVCSEPEE